MYDVIISGAGPAGSKCAEEIAKKGYKVALIERDTKWRKPCGGAVSASIFKYFPRLREYDFQKINGINIYSADFHKLEYYWKGIRNTSINVDRLEFDQILQNIAVDAGAELFDKHLSYDFISKNEKRIGVKTKTSSGTKEFYGKVIIIADGMGSKLAVKSKLRNKWKINEIGLTKVAILEGSTNLNPEFINIFYRPYMGYAWIFPLNQNRFNFGVGTWLDDNLKYDINTLYTEFLKEKEISDLLYQKDYKEVWTSAYPIPAIGVLDRSLYKDNIMMIGDAAGFVSPFSGEGIHASVVSGFIAGLTAVNALDHEDISISSLKQYKQHENIKKIIRNFKMRTSLTDFFFEKNGRNMSKMLELAEEDNKIKEEVINMFLFNEPPSRKLLLDIRASFE
jgi:geranylgeranyl reductase family protein